MLAKMFLGEDFLLDGALAAGLFKRVKDLPIIDYHCHLEPHEIAENKQFRSLTEIWLGGDHYKWRLMRANGVPEDYITGDAPDYEKFFKWAETAEDLIGSPLYHWTHLELKRYFGYDGLLNKRTAADVWEHCNKIITGGNFRVHNILETFGVEALCTTDDPADDLRYHKEIALQGLKTKVLPTFRPSKAFDVESPGFKTYTEKLSKTSGISINDYDTLKKALYKRADFFHEMGCQLSDNAFDPPVYEDYDENELNSIVIMALVGEGVSTVQANRFKTALFVDMGRKYHELGWVMQIHMNAARNNNSRAYKALGSDTGYDSILDTPVTRPLSKLLDSLDREDALAKTILYSLNPAADDVIATMCGNFQGGVKGKIQYGSAWWFNDTKTGMERQMTTLANHGLLARFVGMLTDSRSFLSYTRHEYFRRIMCNLLARYAENGEFPRDEKKLADIAEGIAYYNAREYFML